MPNALPGQSVFLDDVPGSVEVGKDYFFKATVVNLPQSYTVVSYKWDAEWLKGSGASGIVGTINGNPNVPITVPSSALQNTATFRWGDKDAPKGTAKVTVVVEIKKGSDPSETISDQISTTLFGICTPGITGSSSAQRCCTNEITFCATEYCYGNTFAWTWPSGWTLTSGANSQCITLAPDKISSGTVSVTVGRSESAPNYTRSNSKNISRSNPIIRKGNTFPIWDICPGETLVYEVQPVCGAFSYNWVFPSGWTILSGQGSTMVLVYTEISVQPGNIIVEASFEGCPSWQEAFPISVINTLAPTPIFFAGEYPYYSANYHCGNWWICPQAGGDIGPVSYNAGLTQAMTWTVTSPWHFGGGQQTVTTGEQSFSPTIYGPSFGAPPNGQLCVRAENCVGASEFVCVNFRPLYGYWCENPYPIWCECCPPPCEGCPPYMLFTIPIDQSPAAVAPMELNPNPSGGGTRLTGPADIQDVSVQVLDIQGRQVYAVQGQGFPLELECPPHAGVYFVQVNAGAQSSLLKWVVTE